MDIYTVTEDFLKDEIVEGLESLIWTERYNAAGDITLAFPAGSAADKLVVEGTFLSIAESNEVMLIDTKSTDSGNVTATGQTLVGFLVNRMFRNSWTTTNDVLNSDGSAGGAASLIVDAACINGTNVLGAAAWPNGTSDVFPKLILGPVAAGADVTLALEYGDVYSIVKTACDSDNVGFTMVPTGSLTNVGEFMFTTYRGLDRTTSQTDNDPVIFEPALDNFTSITELRSIAGYKNVAYAWASNQPTLASVGRAFSNGATATTPRTFDRRVLMVDASDIDGSAYTAAQLLKVLNQKARDALVNNNYVRMVDGQIVQQNTIYVFGTDYGLGDVIELRGDTDLASQARVTEYIRTQDSTGEKAYPTLSTITT